MFWVKNNGYFEPSFRFIKTEVNGPGASGTKTSSGVNLIY